VWNFFSGLNGRDKKLTIHSTSAKIKYVVQLYVHSPYAIKAWFLNIRYNFCVFTTPASYSGVPGSDLGPEIQANAGIVLKLGHGSFLAHSFKLIIHSIILSFNAG
jgi:hypothetical protein